MDMWHGLNSAICHAVTHEISKILDCGLDKKEIELLLLLLKNGEHPEALAKVVKTLRDQKDGFSLDG